MAFLRDEMGQSLNREQKGKLEVNLKKQEIDLYTKRFQELDKDHTGYVSIKKVEKSLQVSPVVCSLRKELIYLLCLNFPGTR